MRTIPELAEGTHRAKASGTLPNGKPVIVNADGTVSVITETSVSASTGSQTTFRAGETTRNNAVYDTANQKLVIFYRSGTQSDDGYAVVGTISGTSITFGTPVTFSNDNANQPFRSAYDSVNEKVVAVWGSDTSPYPIYAVVGTVSGTNISFGSVATVFSGYSSGGGTSQPDIVYDVQSGKMVVVYTDEGENGKGTAVVGTVSGASISFGADVQFEQGHTYFPSPVYDSVNEKIVISYRDIGNSSYGTAIVGTVSGTSISFGTPVVFESAESNNICSVFDPSAGSFATIYTDDGNSSYTTYVVGTVSGTSISFGTATTINNTRLPIGPNTGRAAFASGQVTLSYKDVGNDSVYLISGTLSGTTITWGTARRLATNRGNYVFTAPAGSATATVYTDPDNSDYGEIVIDQVADTTTSLTSENYIGMSQGVVSSETVTQALGSVVDITNTQPEYIAMAHDENANKIVVAYKLGSGNEYGYAAVGTVSGTSITFGTPVAYTSSALQNSSQSVAYDSVNNKVVISFTLQGGGNRYGTAIVGTVSGNSISFGSAVTFNAGVTAWTTSVFDSNNNKIVISYSDGGNSDYGTAIVGTVSGTSISFGSEVVFESANSGYLGSAFDSTNNKVVISYRDDGNSGKGTAIVGTVSGTSISFGTAAIFNDASTYWTDATFDSTNGKAVIIYMDDGNSQHGTAIVGTVSGTDITFGSEVVFSASATTAPVAAFDSGVGKVTVAYRNSGNSNNTTIIPATVSGTSISFDSPVDVGIANGGGESIGIVFDNTSNKSVVAFKDDTANDNSAVVFRNAGTITTRGQVNAGSSATVDIIGSLSTNQSGLTAGQSYYVQTDGTIGETAADPSVFAGTAISATSLVVKT